MGESLVPQQAVVGRSYEELWHQELALLGHERILLGAFCGPRPESVKPGEIRVLPPGSFVDALRFQPRLQTPLLVLDLCSPQLCFLGP